MKGFRLKVLSFFALGLTSVLFLMLFVLGTPSSLDGNLPIPDGADLNWYIPAEEPQQKPNIDAESVTTESSTVINLESALSQSVPSTDAEEAEEGSKAETMDESFVIPVTETEFDLLCFIVEREVRGHSMLHKQIITQVIVNRVKNPKFPNTVYAVIHRKNQFSTLSNYYSPKYMPTEETIAAVRSVLDGSWEDVSKGAVFFYAPARAKKSSANWFENDLQFLFELEGHRFFKHKTK